MPMRTDLHSSREVIRMFVAPLAAAAGTRPQIHFPARTVVRFDLDFFLQSPRPPTCQCTQYQSAYIDPHQQAGSGYHKVTLVGCRCLTNLKKTTEAHGKQEPIDAVRSMMEDNLAKVGSATKNYLDLMQKSMLSVPNANED